MDLEQWFSDALQAQSLIIIVLAYAGGVISTLLPCSVAMLPVLIGYVGGYADTSGKWDIFCQVVLFVVGLASVMTLLGLAAGALGITFGAWAGSWWYYAAGGIAVLMGLQLLQIIHIPLPQFIQRLPESGYHKTGLGKYTAPVLLGLAFGAASSPCGTPFLAGIVALISQAKNVALGGMSLFAYGLGQGTLLILVGMFTGLLKHQATLRHVGSIINIMSGIVFIIAGLILFLEGHGVLTEWLIKTGLL